MVAILAGASLTLWAAAIAWPDGNALDAFGGTAAPQAVTEAEALDFTARLIDATDDPDTVTFCDQFASNRTMCERSLSEFGAQSRVVADWSVADLSMRETHSGTQVVTFTRPDGAQSEIEVLRDGGEIRAVDPVYWAPRSIVG